MKLYIILLVFLHFFTEICSKPIIKEGSRYLLNKVDTQEDWIELAKYYVANHKSYNVKKYLPYRPLNKTNITKPPANWFMTIASPVMSEVFAPTEPYITTEAPATTDISTEDTVTTEGPTTTDIPLTTTTSQTTADPVSPETTPITVDSVTITDPATTILPITTWAPVSRIDIDGNGTFSNGMDWESTTSVPKIADTTSKIPITETSTPDSATETFTTTTELPVEINMYFKDILQENDRDNQYMSTTEVNVLGEVPSIDFTTETSTQQETTTEVIDDTTQDYNREIFTENIPNQPQKETTTKQFFTTITSYYNDSEGPDQDFGIFGSISTTAVPDTTTEVEYTTIQIQETTTQITPTTTEAPLLENETTTTEIIKDNTENSTEKMIGKANVIEDIIQPKSVNYTYGSDVMPEDYWFENV